MLVVKTGFDRTDVAYVWPRALGRPSDVVLVYLDLNHWIGLAKAATGHSDGDRYRPALDLLRQRRDRVARRLPLSTTWRCRASPAPGSASTLPP